jgi:hypothetical protein
VVSETPQPYPPTDFPLTMIRLTDLMHLLLSALLNIFRGWLLSRSVLALENAALRQQLVAYQRTHKRPRLRTEDRLLWIALRRIWSAWDRSLTIVKPETVIAWHRQGFKLLRFAPHRSRQRDDESDSGMEEATDPRGDR